MKVGILSFEQWHGKKDIGSTMIRVKWLLEKWTKDDEFQAEEFKIGEKYDAVIFQKVYWLEYAKDFKGIKILDLCDPDWMLWNTRIKEMIDNVDAVTCATEKISEFIRQLTDKPVITISDRVNLDMIKRRKNHEGNGRTNKAAWFGYSQNFQMVTSSLRSLTDMKLGLVVISNQIFTLPERYRGKIEVENYPWHGEHWQNDLLRADIVINPRMTDDKWAYKSENKTIISWALGIPVAHTDKELKMLMKEEERIEAIKKADQEIAEKWDIKYSVEQYKELLKKLNDKRK